MKLSQIVVENYRNLDGLTICLDSPINFIVGENNLGKSNFMALLNIIFTKSKFTESDFCELRKPITVRLKITLDDVELGLFGDLFDPENSEDINILAVQNTPDDNICFTHLETGIFIPYSSVRRINYIHYDSLRTPTTELNFHRNRGGGRFLNYIINRYLNSNEISEIDFIDNDKIGELVQSINQKLGKIKVFREFELQASVENDIEEFLGKIISLIDPTNIKINNTGYGVQFMSLVPLVVLERILNVAQTTGFMDTGTGKVMPMLLGLDEPEIHLHPYMQRKLVKYIRDVVNNQEEDFSSLIKDVFDLDLFSGQVLIATHSPNILLNDYKQIVRFHRNDDRKTVVTSGANITLPEPIEKHLLKNMPYIKEAFFSRCVILVEGDSEYGALPTLARRFSYDLDDLGISVIQANGGDSVPPLMDLLTEFGIPNIGILDKDKKTRYEGRTNLFFTVGQDFEEEVLNAFNFMDYVHFLEDNFPQSRCSFVPSARKLGIHIDCRQPVVWTQLQSVEHDQQEALKALTFDKELAFLRSNKGIITGQQLAQYVTVCPTVYSTALGKAKDIVNNG